MGHGQKYFGGTNYWVRNLVDTKISNDLNRFNQ